MLIVQKMQNFLCILNGLKIILVCLVVWETGKKEKTRSHPEIVGESFFRTQMQIKYNKSKTRLKIKTYKVTTHYCQSIYTISILFFYTMSNYHTMHYRAKRGLAIACCLSVCLSVCLSFCLSVCLSVRLSVMLVDHDNKGWKSWKLIARTINPKSSLFIAQRSVTYSPGTWENFGEIRRGVGKSGVLEHKNGNISETR